MGFSSPPTMEGPNSGIIHYKANFWFLSRTHLDLLPHQEGTRACSRERKGMETHLTIGFIWKIFQEIDDELLVHFLQFNHNEHNTTITLGPWSL